MMRLSLIALLLFFGLCTALLAKPIAVRSGDHGTFTRLAFDLPKSLKWSVSTNGRDVIIDFEGHSDGFFLGTVFDRIDRRHVAEISNEGSQIRLKLACKCKATAFTVSNRMVAVDVIETGRPIHSSGSSAEPPALSAPQPREEKPTVDPPLRPIADSDALTPMASLVGNEQATIVLDLQDQLVREVASAATRGLLTTAGKLEPRQKTGPVTAMHQRPLESPEAFSPEPDDKTNIRFSSGMDPLVSAPDPRFSMPPKHPACDATEQVSIAEWSDGRKMQQQISDLRARLFDDRDNLNKKVAKRLARVYLHFGFGPEAMRILQLDLDLQRANGALIEIGEIMEFGFVHSPRVLTLSMDCTGPISMWSIIAMERLDPTLVLNVDSALLELNGLPLHLREILAPLLSNRLLNYGDREAASTALRSLKRTGKKKSASAKLAESSIDLARGESKIAQKDMKTVISSNTDQSAKALIKYVDSRISEGRPVSSDTALLVEAYLQELRGGALEADMRRAQVLSLTQSGQFDAAFYALERYLRDGLESKALYDTVIARLSEDAEDIVFLNHIMQHLDSGKNSISDPTQILAAGRLMALGFADEAETLLTSVTRDLSAPTTRRLKAKIALAQNKPALALTQLAGFSAAEDLRLIAKAKQLLGDLNGASKIFLELGDQAAAERTALISENWAAMLPEKESDFGHLASIVQTNIAPPQERSGMLAQTESALNESAKTRRYLKELILE